jgi:hypothetical protein
MMEPKNSLLINYHIDGYASSLIRLVLSKLIILVLGKKFLACCGIPRSVLYLTVHHQIYLLRV